MQLMPETWADLRLRYGLGSDPFDPRDNILAGAAYLRELHDRFGDSGFLAAYNAGPARYEAFLATGRPLPDETRAYLGALAPLTAGGSAETRLAVAATGAIMGPSAALRAVRGSFFSRTWTVVRCAARALFGCRSSGRFDRLRAAVERPVCRRLASKFDAMSTNAPDRGLAGSVVLSALTGTGGLERDPGRQDKSADLGRAHVVGRVRFFRDWTDRACWRLRHKVQGIQRSERHRAASRRALAADDAHATTTSMFAPAASVTATRAPSVPRASSAK